MWGQLSWCNEGFLFYFWFRQCPSSGCAQPNCYRVTLVCGRIIHITIHPMATSLVIDCDEDVMKLSSRTGTDIPLADWEDVGTVGVDPM